MMITMTAITQSKSATLIIPLLPGQSVGIRCVAFDVAFDGRQHWTSSSSSHSSSECDICVEVLTLYKQNRHEEEIGGRRRRRMLLLRRQFLGSIFFRHFFLGSGFGQTTHQPKDPHGHRVVRQSHQQTATTPGRFFSTRFSRATKNELACIVVALLAFPRWQWHDSCRRWTMPPPLTTTIITTTTKVCCRGADFFVDVFKSTAPIADCVHMA
jgi:hypothetical protein